MTREVCRGDRHPAKDLPPLPAVTLDVQYGEPLRPIPSASRRMGAPDDVRARNDLDEISDSFTAVRGLGYVVWYPVAIDAVSMSDAMRCSMPIAAWKHRHDRSEFQCANHRSLREHGISVALPSMLQLSVAARPRCE